MNMSQTLNPIPPQSVNPPSSTSSPHLHPGLNQHQPLSHHHHTHHDRLYKSPTLHNNNHHDSSSKSSSSTTLINYNNNNLHPPPSSNLNPTPTPLIDPNSLNHHHHPILSRTISPSLSHRSSPTPSPTSSPSSPPFYNSIPNPSSLLDLNSVVSYSQLIQRRDDVVNALKYRSGDHYGPQALELLKAGRERVKRITAAGRAATGKPPVKHIQEQYLAVFSRFSEYCASQNIPTWPIEPVRVAIWVLAMQEKAPPTPATLRQYITRLEFTCTVTASLFEPEFGPSSPLKASALLRELVNRDLPGHPNPKPTRSPALSSTTNKPISFKRNRTSLSAIERSITPPSSKKWHPQSSDHPPPPPQPQHSSSRHHDYPIEHYDAYLPPFGTPSSYLPSLSGPPPPPHHPSHPSAPGGDLWPPRPLQPSHHHYSSDPPYPPPPHHHQHHPHHHPHLDHHRDLLSRQHDHNPSTQHLDLSNNVRTPSEPHHPRSLYHHQSSYVSTAPNSSSFSAPTSASTPTASAVTPVSAPQSLNPHDPRFTSSSSTEPNPWVS